MKKTLAILAVAMIPMVAFAQSSPCDPQPKTPPCPEEQKCSQWMCPYKEQQQSVVAPKPVAPKKPVVSKKPTPKPVVVTKKEEVLKENNTNNNNNSINFEPQIIIINKTTDDSKKKEEKKKVQPTIIKKKDKKNNLLFLGGIGRNKLTTESNPQYHSVEVDHGVVLGVQYNRQVGDNYLIGVTVLTNETALLNAGFEF